MKHAIILAHPSETSFTATMARAYETAVRVNGHTVAIRDLYRMKFDPCLRESEIPWSNNCETPP